VTGDPFVLDGDPGSLAAAVRAWREVAAGALGTADRVAGAARTLLSRWDGEAASAYDAHQARVGAALRGVGTVTAQIAATVDEAVLVARRAESHLLAIRTGLRRWMAAHPGSSPAGMVQAGVREALRIRADVEVRLAGLASTLDALGHALFAETDAVRAALQARTGWSARPDPEAPPPFIVDGHRVIVSGTGYDDSIQVGVDPTTGATIVTVDGVRHALPPEVDLVVRAGTGNDTITVATGVPVRVTLLGGSGDDRISGSGGDERILGLWGRDTLDGGAGADRLDGGADADYLDGQGGDDRLAGGSGDDTLYGLQGRDVLWGADGADYLDGGADDDRLTGGADSDVLVGGRGVDRIAGGGGDDRVFTEAADDVSGVWRRVTVELTDVGGFIQVQGSPEFVARVESDLDALRSSDSGAAMLAALQHSHDTSASALAGWPVVGHLVSHGNTLVIRETPWPNGITDPDTSFLGGVDSTVAYNPEFRPIKNGAPTPPVVVLFHELAHVYDAFEGTAAHGIYLGDDNPGAPNAEREAVGLPIDPDGRPSTPDTLAPGHPYALTENGLRDEFGLARRLRYD
jgi:uncharacterized protein YukE